MTQPIFLVGPRGCGKTTVGLALARACQSQFVDTDHWLQTQARQTIAELSAENRALRFALRQIGRGCCTEREGAPPHESDEIL